jgi:iron complex outermembrane receptor protein
LELGARAEKQTIDLDPGTDLPDYDATVLSLSAGVVRKLSNENTLALNLTHTERNPQAAELYSQPDVPHVAAQRFSTGDPNLDQEKALTADLSLRHGGEGTQWTLSAFYDDYSDYIFENPTGVLLPTEEGEEFQLFDYLQADARFYGFEGEVLFPVYEQGERRLDLRVASDYVRGKLDDGSDLPLIPPLRFGVGMEYDQGDWHVGVDAYYYEKQDRIADNELPTESFTLVDLDTSYRLPVGAAHLFVFLRGTNLLDEDARQHASPLKDIAPLPGRSFHIGARAEF